MTGVKRIVKNTGILYLRMLITIGISLYSTRIVLGSLGAADYGIFTLIAGVIAMLSFINAAMATSTQRYLSFNMGLNDISKIKKIFANSVVIHFIIGIILVVVFEVIGFYILNTKLKIEPERMFAAKLLFHFAVASSFISIISVPFDAVINAHENMMYIAVMNIVESILRLITAFVLTITVFDKLVVYGFLMMAISIFIALTKRFYCKRRYEECTVNYKEDYDKPLIKELTSFASWNLFGVICGVFRNQGTSVLLNLFFGTLANAAYGIANQVNGQLSFLSIMMMKAIRPQMMKSEGGGERTRMIKLSIVAGKFSFFLYAIISIPLYIEMSTILHFWLKNVPQYTIDFCRLILLLNLIQQFSTGIMAATQAIGKVRMYQIVVGTSQLLTLPIAYLLLRAGFPVNSVLITAIVVESMSTILRVFQFKTLTNYLVTDFFNKVIFKALLPTFITFVLTFFVYSNITDNGIRVVSVFLFSTAFYLTIVYFIGVTKEEKVHLDSIAMTLLKKIKLK